MAQSMDKQIAGLEDAEAVRVLVTVARGHAAGTAATPVVQTLREVLAAMPEEATGPTTPTDGEAARAALTLLAENEQLATAIGRVMNGPEPQKMIGIVGGAVLAAGLLLALQTHVRIEKNAAGKVTWKIEKKPTSNGMLGTLIRKILTMVT